MESTNASRSRPADRIAEWLRLLMQPGQVFEIRGVGCSTDRYKRPHPRAGFFDTEHLAEAAAAAQWLTWESGGRARGVYFTLNPLNPALLSRRSNRIDVADREFNSAESSDVLSRRWLLVDCDPVRPSGVSSTSRELLQAREVAIRIRNHLQKLEWPDPLLGDSGNGYHLLYRIDLPADDAGLIKRCLQSLAAQFRNEHVDIDRKVFDPIRICKLYGTWARKGDSTPDRPHRRASIVPTDHSRVTVVPRELLQMLAAGAPPEPKPVPRGKQRGGPSVLERARNYILKKDISISGQGGHDKAYQVACVLTRGFALEPEHAFGLMSEWNEGCEPPWSERELWHKIEQASKHGTDELGALLRPLHERIERADENEFLPMDGAAVPAAAESHEGNGDNGSNGDGFEFSLDDLLQSPTITAQQIEAAAAPGPSPLPPLPIFDLKITVNNPLGTIEESDDPHRLARLYLQRYQFQSCITLRYWREIWWRWGGTTYTQIDEAELRAEVTASIKEEFDRENAAAIEHLDPNKPIPRTRKVTLGIISNTVNAIKSLVILPSETAMPSWLDRRHVNREARDFIAMQNGIFDVRAFLAENATTPTLLPHSPLWFSAACVPFPYLPQAGCPKWLNFLDTNLQGNHEQSQMLCEWFGYCLTPDMSFQRFLLLEGEGKNGKSVILAALTAVLGKSNVTHVPLEMFADRFQLTRTIGKLANIIPEVGEIDRVAEGVLKAFTAGDRMTFDRKFKDAVEENPTARLTLSVNNRPRFSDRSSGLWRRMLILPLTYIVPDDQRVYGMDTTEFWAGECPGIFNWALMGLAELRRWRRFTIPEASIEHLEDYRQESNPCRRFLAETYEPVPPDHAGESWVVRADAYKAYTAWCKATGHQPMNAEGFGREVKRLWPHVRCERRRSTTNARFRTYEGLRLLPDADVENEFT